MVDQRNVDFVIASRKAGKSDDEIYDAFEEAGYTPEEIKEIFDEVNKQTTPTAQPTEAERGLESLPEKKFHLTTPMKLAIVIAIGLAIAGSIIYGLVLIGT